MNQAESQRVWEYVRDRHSRQAWTYIFLTRMFPAVFNQPLSLWHPESSSSYNHIYGGPRQEHRPPRTPRRKGFKTAPYGRVRVAEGVRLIWWWWQEDRAAGGALVPSLNTCRPQEGGWRSRRLERRVEMDQQTHHIDRFLLSPPLSAVQLKMLCRH